MKQELKTMYEDSLKPFGQCLLYPFMIATSLRRDGENPEKYNKTSVLWRDFQPFSLGYLGAVDLGLPIIGIIEASKGNMKGALIGLTPWITNGVSALYESYRKASKKVKQGKGLENNL